ncbi:uncharacterized protein FOMMEDRAFT_143335 [Fomitiporia mediterranea MF3/22]|uniref:uncharacterized protein n=1 Tax=Fomitiporia mediterranea (strain MF3/22) TaxID=694068 RepID=UPI0004407A81|nr:uncharacterized protein FOMMEDRAFT_143335 [Fomitiporia mediterranea MF3/22]EJC98261.1 hypothetical protein FOMMEDRAFT_143335 [Fomitiporia mediterranea MF3/22]
MSTLHMVSSFAMMVQYTSFEIMRPDELSSCHWSLALQIMLTTFGNGISRSYSVFRLYNFSNKIGSNVKYERTRYGMIIVAVFLCLLSLGSGLALSIILFIHSQFAYLVERPYIVYLLLFSTCISDVFVCSCLLRFFWKMHQENIIGQRALVSGVRTNTSLKKLAAYHAGDCLIASCVNLACMVTFSILSDKPIYLSIYCITSQLYFCSTLVTEKICRNVNTVSGRPRTISLTDSVPHTSTARSGLKIPRHKRNSSKNVGLMKVMVKTDVECTSDSVEPKQSLSTDSSLSSTSTEVATGCDKDLELMSERRTA